MKPVIRLASVEPQQNSHEFTFRTPGTWSNAAVSVRIETGKFPDDETCLRVAKAYAANILNALAEQTEKDRLTPAEINKLEVPKA